MTAEARIVEAVRGVEVGKVIRIDASPWICNSTLDPSEVGRDGFIAGEFRSGGDSLLTGFWDRRHARTQSSP